MQEALLGRLIVALLRLGRVQVQVTRSLTRSTVFIHVGRRFAHIVFPTSQTGTNVIDPPPGAVVLGNLLAELVEFPVDSSAVANAYSSLVVTARDLAARDPQDSREIFLVDYILDALFLLGLEMVQTSDDKSAMIVYRAGHTSRIVGHSSGQGTAFPESLSICGAQDLVMRLGLSWEDFLDAYKRVRSADLTGL